MFPDFERLTNRLETVPSPVTLADAHEPDLPIVYCNPAFLSLTGYTENEVVGQNCRFLQGDLTGQPGTEEIRAALETKQHATTVLTNFTKDGSAFRNLLYIDMLNDHKQELQLMIGCQYALPSLVTREAVTKHVDALANLADELEATRAKARDTIMRSLTTRAKLTVSMARSVFG